MATLPATAERAQRVRAYAPPRASGVRARLKLDANECLAADPLPLEAARRALDTANFYPMAGELESRLAERFGVEPARVLVTAGGDDALGRVCQAYLEHCRCALLTPPTFEMLERYVRLAGAEVAEVPWTGGPFPIDAALSCVRTRLPMLSFVVSPNNPTGAVATSAQLKMMSDEALRVGSIVVADLAYEEFADEPLMPTAIACPNVVAVRTFSKAWGLAGLRLGYAVGPTEAIAAMRAVGQPYAVGVPAIAAGLAALDLGEQPVRALAQRVAQQRTALAARLVSLGASVDPTQGNFILATFADTAGAWCLADALAERSIAVRRFPTDTPLGRCLRVTCPGAEAAMDELERTLSEIRP